MSAWTAISRAAAPVKEVSECGMTYRMVVRLRIRKMMVVGFGGIGTRPVVHT